MDVRRYTDDELFAFQRQLAPLVRDAHGYVSGGFDHDAGVLTMLFTYPVPADFVEQAGRVIPKDSFTVRALPEGWTVRQEYM